MWQAKAEREPYLIGQTEVMGAFPTLDLVINTLPLIILFKVDESFETSKFGYAKESMMF